MGVTAIALEDLIKESKLKTSARYTQLKGKKFKTEEFQNLDPQIKEKLDMGDQSVDWSKIDEELDKYNKEYDSETDIIQREIISLKYDLLVEEFIETDLERVKKIKYKLNILIELSKVG